jgi:spermidine synthase
MLDLLGFSFVVLSVGSFLWGLLFTLGAKSMALDHDKLWSGVNKAYVLESLGSVVGGILFSFVFATLLSSMQIVFLLVCIAWGVVVWVVLGKKRRFKILTLTTMAFVFFILLAPVRSLEQKVNAFQWSFINEKLTFVRSLDTKYQNLSLLSLENQYTVYADGRPAYIIPNTEDAELFIHTTMVQRPHAKRVLILGGGFNGGILEVLKYPVQEVDYVEIDPALIPFIEPVLNIQDQQALHDSRVRINVMDGRDFLRRQSSSFDFILMNVGEPTTASLNRFYTVEFFQQCYRSLHSDGIFALSFPSSGEYLADELKDLDASLYQTMKSVFMNILIIPGTHAVLIGTKTSVPFISQPDSLAHRYAAAGISAEYFSKYMFEELMPPDRIKFITNTLADTKNVRLNTDNNPVTYYCDLLLWNRFLQGNNLFFSSITPFWIFSAGGAASGFMLLLILLRRRQPKKQCELAAIIVVCGMIGMALNLLYLLNFQEAFGSIYEMIGVMIAANILGLLFGTLAASKLFGNYKQNILLLAVLIALMGVVLLLPNLFNFLLFARRIPITLFVAILNGGLIGMIYGLVNRLYLHRSSHVGSVYAFDVFGSSVGALTTCSVLLPVLGLQGTAIFLALILCPALAAVMVMGKSN